MFRFVRQAEMADVADMRLATSPASLRAGNSASEQLDHAPPPPPHLKVVIVGAGMAGLSAAYELQNRGCQVTVLEADRKHVGGRVRTCRFDDGTYGELGAMRIPASHKITRDYVTKFGLTMRKFVQSNKNAYFHVRGRRVRIQDVSSLKPSFQLAPHEAALELDELWDRAVGRVLRELSPAEQDDLFNVQYQTNRVRELDQVSLDRLFVKSGLSAEAVELLTSCWGLESQLPFSATEHLREERERVWIDPFDEIEGGTDLLAGAFKESLKSKPRSGCEVFRIEQSANRVSAIYRHEGKSEREEGDYLICTVPLPVLARIEIHPPFSPQKQRAIRQISYDSSTKILARCAQRFWELEDQIFGGGSACDLPTVFAYYPSDNEARKDPKVSTGPGVLLASYTWGQTARRMGLLPAETQEIETREALKLLHPQIAQKPDLIQEMRSWSWDQFPYSGGAFAWFSPGQHTALYHDLIREEGRVLLAGEHASLTHTWMQGAFESAKVAVAAVLRSSIANP